MRIGIGGSLFGVRGGISTRGIGVGLGPLSVSSSWRRRRRRRSGGSGGFWAGLVVLAILALIVAWPYLLATFVAVQLGADNPSTTRTVVGWVFEAPWLLFLIFVGLAAVFGSSATSDNETLGSATPDNEIRRVKRGQSAAYVHPGCTVNHRTSETATRCAGRRR